MKFMGVLAVNTSALCISGSRRPVDANNGGLIMGEFHKYPKIARMHERLEILSVPGAAV